MKDDYDDIQENKDIVETVESDVLKDYEELNIDLSMIQCFAVSQIDLLNFDEEDF